MPADPQSVKCWTQKGNEHPTDVQAKDVLEYVTDKHEVSCVMLCVIHRHTATNEHTNNKHKRVIHSKAPERNASGHRSRGI